MFFDSNARVCENVQSLLTAVQSLSLCEIHQLYSKPCLNTHSLTDVVHRPSSYLGQAVLTKSKSLTVASTLRWHLRRIVISNKELVRQQVPEPLSTLQCLKIGYTFPGPSEGRQTPYIYLCF